MLITKWETTLRLHRKHILSQRHHKRPFEKCLRSALSPSLTLGWMMLLSNLLTIAGLAEDRRFAVSSGMTFVRLISLTLMAFYFMSLPIHAKDTLLSSAELLYSERTVVFKLDGRKVVGTLTMPDNQLTPPIVLILHGMGGNRHGADIRGTNRTLFTQTAQIFAAGGVASLRISTGGRGGSEGSFQDMTLERRVQEALAALKWISSQGRFNESRIGILGHSQGATIAVSTAQRMDALRPVNSIMLWAPQSKALETYRRAMGEVTYQKGINAAVDEIVKWRVGGGNTRAFKRDFFIGLADFDTLNDVEEYEGRLLVITGKRDRWSTTSSAQVFKYRHDGETALLERNVGHRMGASIDISAVNSVAQSSLDFFNSGITK